MKRFKVLFDASAMVDSKKTGVGYYVDYAIRALAEAEPETTQLEGYFFNFLGLNTNHIPAITNVRFHKIWLMPGKLLSLCRRLSFQPFLELFTWHSGDILFFTNYVMLPRLRKRPTALAIYDLGYLDHPEYMQAVNLNYLQRFCSPSILQADLIVTISVFTKERLQAHFPELRTPIVVTPIPPAPLTYTSVQTLSGRLNDLGILAQRYLLYLGTIEPRTNIQQLVRAYALLDEQSRSTYSLVLAGGRGWKDEAILSEIKSLQDKGLRIIQTGYVDDHEKAALYANSRGFVFPSHYEGFGMPILEAMQYNVPVAISDLSVFHETAGNAALYFNKDEPADIATVLQTLLGDDLKRQELLRLSAEQLAKFSWTHNAHLLLNAFHDVSQS